MEIKTAKEAKKLSLKVWVFLRNHPYIDTKDELIEEYPKFKWLEDCNSRCPLCEYFKNFYDTDCHKCPLIFCIDYDAPYKRWANATNMDERKKAANDLVKQLKAWKV